MGKKKSVDEWVLELKEFVANNDGRLPKQQLGAGKGTPEDTLAAWLNRTQGKIKKDPAAQDVQELLNKLRELPSMEARVRDWEERTVGKAMALGAPERQTPIVIDAETIEKPVSSLEPKGGEVKASRRAPKAIDAETAEKPISSLDDAETIEKPVSSLEPVGGEVKASGRRRKATDAETVENPICSLDDAVTIEKPTSSREPRGGEVKASKRRRKAIDAETVDKPVSSLEHEGVQVKTSRRRRKAIDVETGDKPISSLEHEGGQVKASSRPRRRAKTLKKREDPSPNLDQDFIGIILEGRASDRKNKSINGRYVQMENSFEGNHAYEKRAASDDDGPKLYVFYSTEKSRWKISPTLGDSKGGLAQCKTNISTSPADVRDSAWLVFEGKDGYKEDNLISCTHSQALSDLDQGTKDGHIELGVTSTGSEARVDTDSVMRETDSYSDESSSSSTGTGVDTTKSQNPTTSPPNSSIEKPLVGFTTPNDSELIEKPPLASPTPEKDVSIEGPPRGRICAKMLARSRLRCVCHYQYFRDCPFALL